MNKITHFKDGINFHTSFITRRIASAARWTRNYFAKTTNGMAIGLFGTLIIGTILAQIFEIAGNDPSLKSLTDVIKGLMGAGIGLGVALSLKKENITTVTAMAVGQVATYAYSFASGKLSAINDPLVAYLAVILFLGLQSLIIRRKTPVDMILIPLFGLLVAVLFAMVFGYYLNYITIGIGKVVKAATNFMPLPMCIIISVLMGMALTAPISSVAIAVMINIGAVPVAAGAALIGCSVQMVGFAIQSIHDNKPGKVIAIGIGTSMLQFKNIVKKPIIFLPTIIVSALLGPLAMLIDFNVSSVGAGMGTSGLVGFIQAYKGMGYTASNFFILLAVLIIAPLILVFAVDLLFRHLKLIKKGDLALDV